MNVCLWSSVTVYFYVPRRREVSDATVAPSLIHPRNRVNGLKRETPLFPSPRGLEVCYVVESQCGHILLGQTSSILDP